MPTANPDWGGPRYGYGRPRVATENKRVMLQTRVHPDTLRRLHALRGANTLGRYLDLVVAAMAGAEGHQ